MSKLTLITLPIGNIKDITGRALEYLKSNRIYLAEDTRVFRSLLSHLDIEIEGYQIDSFHDHSSSKLALILDRLKNGEELALVSDAGSPVISDPAFPLIREAILNDIQIETLPGVSSVTTALELSGLPPHPFMFHGFLPREKEGVKSFFKSCSTINGTHIVFESPNRILNTLKSLANSYPDTNVCVARELTKKFQDVRRFKASSFLESDFAEIMTKGEFVLLYNFENKNKQTLDIENLEALANTVLAKANSKNLSKLLGYILGEDTKQLYNKLSQNKPE